MGCDYYIIVDLVITYTHQCKIEKEYIEIERLRMYHFFTYDKDKDNYDELAQQEMQYMTNTYQKLDKTLYTNNKWLINNQDVIEEYVFELKQHDIKLDDVITIEKNHYCRKR